MYLPLPDKITDILESKAIQMQYGYLMNRKWITIEQEDLKQFAQENYLKTRLSTLSKENKYFIEQFNQVCLNYDKVLKHIEKKYLKNIKYNSFYVDIDQEKIYYN